MNALKKFFLIGGGSRKVEPLKAAKELLNFKGRINCLVIDDDAEYGRLVVEFLATEKIDAALATDGDRAFKLLDAQQFDCVLLDYNLNDEIKNGDWVVKNLREKSESLNYNTPIIIISGYIDHEHEVMNEKVQGMLEKPVSNAILSSMIRQIVKKN